MKKAKKSGNQDKALQTIILVTAILNLVRAGMDLLQRLIE